MDSQLGRLPSSMRDIIVGFACIVLAVGLRLMVELFVVDAVPFALTFPAVIAAALLAGWRAALICIAGCQLLVWYFVMPPIRSFEILSAGQATSLVLTTVAQLLSTWAVTAYRSSARALAGETERRVELMSIALKEIDHRTKNNFQLVAGLLTMQAMRAPTPDLAGALNDAAARLQSIAGTYKNLSVNSVGLTEVSLDRHFGEICAALKGALPPRVDLGCSIEPMTVAADQAVPIGLIVNEWATNAAKHAFRSGEEGRIEIRVERAGDRLRVEVADSGENADCEDAEGNGLGTSLVKMLAESLDARIEVQRNGGTRCILTVPLDPAS